MKRMLKEAAILFAITLISGCLLGLVYEVTKEPIAEAKAKAEQEAFQEVFTDAASFEETDLTSADALLQAVESEYNTTIDKVMLAKDSAGTTLGYVITVTNHEGYGGDIQFSVGICNDGTINGISILEIGETAGLGMKADPVLKEQFAEKNVTAFTVTKTGAASDEQIDAISGATITSNAFVRGVNGALHYFYEVQGGGNSNE